MSIEAIKKKSEAIGHTARFLAKEPSARVMRTDNGTEFLNEASKLLFQKFGVAHQTTAPGCSYSNGSVERAHLDFRRKGQHLLNTLRLHSRLDLLPWLTAAVERQMNVGKRDEPPPTVPLLRLVSFSTPADPKPLDSYAALNANGKRVGLFLGNPHAGAAICLTVCSKGLIVYSAPSISVQPLSPEGAKEFIDALAPFRDGDSMEEEEEANDEEEPDDDTPSPAVSPAAAPAVAPKRRGRPPKQLTEDSKKTPEDPPAPRRKPGRPRKHPLPTPPAADPSPQAKPADPPASNSAAPLSGILPRRLRRIIRRLEVRVSEEQEHKYDPLSLPTLSAALQQHSISPQHIGKSLALRRITSFEHQERQCVVSGPPVKGQVHLTPVINGSPRHEESFTAPLVDLPDNIRAQISFNLADLRARARPKKGGKSGGYVEKGWGYVGEDEAPPEDVRSGLFDAADLKEWTAIQENEVLIEATPPPDAPVIPTRHRHTWKVIGGEGSEVKRKAKTRFIVQACNDPRVVATHTSLPGAEHRRLGKVWAAHLGLSGATQDVCSAFLTVPMTTDV